MPDNLLADILYSSSMKNFGSDEHMQIAGLIKKAKKNVIEKNSALEIRHLLNRNPATIERGLKFIQRPAEPIWYEWGLETRSGHGGDENAKTGCLIAPHPFDDDLVLSITGWTTDGQNARHAFAIALFDTNSLTQLSKHAIGVRAGSPEASLSRIMSAIEVTMPPGFGDEISILTDDDPMAKQRSYRDATAEIPFLFAIMLFERCIGGLVETVVDDAVVKTISGARTPNFWHKLLNRDGDQGGYVSPSLLGRTRPVYFKG